MPDKPCPDPEPHGRHEWYWLMVFRRDCPGAGWDKVGVCTHGRSLLDRCDDCPGDAS